MKKFLLASAAILFACQANAADLGVASVYKAPPVVAPFTWSGLYFGGNFGYGFSGGTDTISGNDQISNFFVGSGFVPSGLNTQAQGWLGGAQVGYNWQFGNFVVGAEADIQGSALDGSDNQTLQNPNGGPPSLVTHADWGSNWFGTLRARGGVTILNPQTIVYITGGMAYGDVHGNTNHVTNFGPVAFTTTDSWSDTKVGWTAGAGWETALTNHWTIGAEYLYVDLGNHDGTATTTANVALPPNFPAISYNDHQKLSFSVVRAKINYKW